MAAVTINLPEGAFNGLSDSPEQFVQELRLAAAIFWYSRGEISQGKGAQIAGLSRREFIEALGRAQVDAIQIDDKDLKDEVERDLQRVVNASPLIYLTHVGLLDVLNEPGVPVVVPERVLTESFRPRQTARVTL